MVKYANDVDYGVGGGIHSMNAIQVKVHKKNSKRKTSKSSAFQRHFDWCSL